MVHQEQALADKPPLAPGAASGTRRAAPGSRILPAADGASRRVLTFSLQSGSNGNSIYVEAGGVRLLFDAGITGRQARLRLEQHGRNIRDVDALIISHNHTDHVAYAGTQQRLFGLPIYITRKTLDHVGCDLGPLKDVRFFRSGERLEFGPVIVHTIPTPHDASDGVAFLVEHERCRLAILTDLGHPFSGLRGILQNADAAYLESNYDPAMLDAGPYPPYLKARIRGQGGHLSNDEAADLVERCGRLRPEWVMLAHLSAHNNTPELALASQQRRIGDGYPVHVASREEASAPLEVRRRAYV